MITEFVQFPIFDRYKDRLVHCFTSKNGGVSTGECSTLNFGFNRNDLIENVKENYQRLANDLGINTDDMVLANQVHDNKIYDVDINDKGKGIKVKSDIIGYDGLVTTEKGVALVTFHADCVPIFFFDKIKNVIGLAHSGWKGTLKNIGGEMVNKMKQGYKCQAEDILIAIGPSIGYCCFEVDDEVYIQFEKQYEYIKDYSYKKPSDKWHINLQGVITQSLINNGIKKTNIFLSDLCTKCNTDSFFSHRGDKGKTGSMIAVMQLR